MAAAWLYDGRHARRHAVEVAAADGAIELRFDDGRAERVPAADLLHATDRDGAQVYKRRDAEGWRLGILPPVPGDLAALLPREQRYGRLIDRVGLAPAVIALLLVSAAVLGIGYLLPAGIAPYIPHSWEQRYGDAIVGDFGGKFCRGSGGQAALDRLAARLSPPDPQNRRRRFDMRVVDLPVVNAAALPGDHIVIFRKLLTEAAGPDEIAGVLAHEIAHVENRDVTEGMIRELGVGLVITALGGTTGGNADMLLGSRYSRAAEAEADAGAIAMLRRSGVSPVPTARFFARLGRGEQKLGRVGTTLAYVSTHPLTEGRRAAFQRSFDPRHPYTPALSREEWRAVVDICRDDAAGKGRSGAGAPNFGTPNSGTPN